MAYVQFENLMQDFCRAAGIEDVGSLRNGGNVIVDDITFSITYDPGVNENALLLFCDFGVLPESHWAEACRALLHVNMFMFNGKGPVFTLNPETNHVIFAAAHLLSEVTAEFLLSSMRKLTEDARNWQKNYFLPEQDRERDSATWSRPAFA